ncbi:hypothetical protein BDW02DRAFT_149471 [Decorospora gaudefroyi]|uniref:Uncharacterized protein n=1 Tax=Decorospora gaudefroyi TaxID=184978 RepID=A0A6A5KLL6_9PLEO|nr:hypothetical protein BDW02DRAFT_149471 [Decorospora gaudefroyi]
MLAEVHAQPRSGGKERPCASATPFAFGASPPILFVINYQSPPRPCERSGCHQSTPYIEPGRYRTLTLSTSRFIYSIRAALAQSTRLFTVIYPRLRLYQPCAASQTPVGRKPCESVTGWRMPLAELPITWHRFRLHFVLQLRMHQPHHTVISGLRRTRCSYKIPRHGRATAECYTNKLYCVFAGLPSLSHACSI